MRQHVGTRAMSRRRLEAIVRPRHLPAVLLLACAIALGSLLKEAAVLPDQGMMRVYRVDQIRAAVRRNPRDWAS